MADARGGKDYLQALLYSIVQPTSDAFSHTARGREKEKQTQRKIKKPNEEEATLIVILLRLFLLLFLRRLTDNVESGKIELYPLSNAALNLSADYDLRVCVNAVQYGVHIIQAVRSTCLKFPRGCQRYCGDIAMHTETCCLSIWFQSILAVDSAVATRWQTSDVTQLRTSRVSILQISCCAHQHNSVIALPMKIQSILDQRNTFWAISTKRAHGRFEWLLSSKTISLHSSSRAHIERKNWERLN